MGVRAKEDSIEPKSVVYYQVIARQHFPTQVTTIAKKDPQIITGSHHNMSSLRGKVVVVTGAASGIGFAIAHLLSQHGVLLSLADLNEEGLAIAADKLRKVYPSDDDATDSWILTTPVDVTSPKQCEEWITKTTRHFKQPIAGAANFAGVVGKSIAQDAGAIRNMDDAEFQFVMDINCRGTFNCMRAELPFMQTGSGGRHGGSIVNAASIAGISGVALNGPYAASKHAVIGLTRSAAKEEGKRAIRINAIAPGIISTPMIVQIETSAGTSKLFGDSDPGALARKGDASEVAEVAVFLLSEQSSFVSGVVIPVDGGWIC